MRYVTLFASSLFLLIYSFYHVNKFLVKDGEYYASLYSFTSTTAVMNIVVNINNSKYVSHLYLKSPALDGIANFVSKGEFLDDDVNGNYTLNYYTVERNIPKVLSPEMATLYFNMVGRTGITAKTHVKLIYHDKDLSIFDMNRNDNIIMYAKKH